MGRRTMAAVGAAAAQGLVVVADRKWRSEAADRQRARALRGITRVAWDRPKHWERSRCAVGEHGETSLNCPMLESGSSSASLDRGEVARRGLLCWKFRRRCLVNAAVGNLRSIYSSRGPKTTTVSGCTKWPTKREIVPTCLKNWYINYKQVYSI
jgi:hypothetical protein